MCIFDKMPLQTSTFPVLQRSSASVFPHCSLGCLEPLHAVPGECLSLWSDIVVYTEQPNLNPSFAAFTLSFCFSPPLPCDIWCLCLGLCVDKVHYCMCPGDYRWLSSFVSCGSPRDLLPSFVISLPHFISTVRGLLKSDKFCSHYFYIISLFYIYQDL